MLLYSSRSIVDILYHFGIFSELFQIFDNVIKSVQRIIYKETGIVRYKKDIRTDSEAKSGLMAVADPMGSLAPPVQVLLFLCSCCKHFAKY